MARLRAQADLEYIPTQERIIPIIRSYLAFPERGTTCLDPCCADGTALSQLCPGQYLFGAELHTGRAIEAKEKEFVKVLVGPFERTIISNRAFGFIHLNPPYDWVAGGGERYEEKFFYRATNYLAPRGIMEMIVPTSLFKSNEVGVRFIKCLLENYRDIQVLKYPEPEFSEHSQIVIFGIKKPRVPVTASPEWFLKRVAAITTGNLPELTIQNEPVYNVPTINPGCVHVFRIDYYDAELAASESQTLDVLKQQSKPVLKDKLTAPFLLDKALLALLAVGGYIDGKMPGHYLSGRYLNHEITNDEIDPETGDMIHSIRKVSTTVFYALVKNPGPDGSRIAEIK